MNKKIYTFHEFIAACESDDFDNIDEDWLEWANDFVIKTDEYMKDNFHDGDCTNMPASCPICTLQTLLDEYHEYTFNEGKWRKENGI